MDTSYEFRIQRGERFLIADGESSPFGDGEIFLLCWDSPEEARKSFGDIFDEDPEAHGLTLVKVTVEKV